MKKDRDIFKAKIVWITVQHFIGIATGYNHTVLMVLFLKMHLQCFVTLE